MRRRLDTPGAQTALAALAYLLITIAVTYPLAFQLTTHIAGIVWGDPLEFVWYTWWFKHALLDLHINPLYINALNYPDSLYVSLLPAMSQSFLLALPLTALTTPATAYNVIFLLSFPACALTTYWLCTELSGDWRAGFVGGLIWGFFPDKTGHALAGHLFQMVVFSLPLAALLMVRLLRRPSAWRAVWAGLGIALAATIHPINVAYCLLPVLAVLVGWEIWRRWRPAPASRPLAPLPWRWLALAAGIAAVLIVPLYLPAVIETMQRGVDFLVIRGTVGLSTDLLAFFVPPPRNPVLVRLPPSLRHPVIHLSNQILLTEFESIGYVGWTALILATIGTWWRWAEGRAWAVLGVGTAVLELGPLLKVGGHLFTVPVETEAYPMLMPYALLENLPLFNWSRTPGRLNETVMLAVAVLAALGLAALLARLAARGWGRAGWAVTGVAGAAVVLESMVVWPMPTFSAQTSPAFRALAEDTSFKAVLNVPIRRNEETVFTLYQQTIHQHPMVGGRVFRDVPGSLDIQTFLTQAIAASESGDTAPGPTNEQRWAALSFYDVGRIVYQKEFDADGTLGAALERLAPGGATMNDDIVAIYPVKPAVLEPSDSFFVFGDNWQAPESWGARLGRWFQDVATVYLFSGSSQTGSLGFTAIPGENLRHLIVKVNGQEIGHFGVGDWADFDTPPVALQPGLNVIQFIDPEGGWPYVGDPRCQGGSEVAGPFPLAVPCDTGRQEEGRYSLAIQALTFGTHPPPEPQAVFGGTFELLNGSAPTQARPGDTLTLHLAWRAARQPGQDYTVFAHLLDADGNYVTGYDSFPARGEYPTSNWAAGETVAQSVPLGVPADAAPGSYTVEVGWYDSSSQERLALENGETSVTVGEVQIGSQQP
jgi:hypothetical protein